MKIGILGLVTMIIFSQCSVEEITIEDANNAPEISADSRGNAIIPNQYIVVLKPDAALKGKKEQIRGKAVGLANRHGFAENPVMQVYSTALQGFVVSLNNGQRKKLEEDDAIDYLEPDRIVALAPPPGKGPKNDNNNPPPPQETPWGIHRVGGAANGSGKTAWIIDSGIDLNHPDLVVDVSRGFTAFTKGKDANLDDGNGHGTHVAGTIAAKDNEFGVVGVAAGATVIPVKVLNSRGAGSWSGVIAGIDYVAEHGQAGDVANMSLGGGINTTIDNAVKNAASTSGVLFVLAAGNESDDASNHSPARANGENIYTISAMDSNDRFASFSNYGSAVDYCAPGVNIKSCWKGGNYHTISGTSMAAPHAAGVLLLGSPSSDGMVIGDPDGNADAIIHL